VSTTALLGQLKNTQIIIIFYTDNGINARAFPQLTDSYIDSEQFAITMGGKLILKKLLKELKDKCT
jgi:hypothetical protein